jgi:hypothetical protein
MQVVAVQRKEELDLPCVSLSDGLLQCGYLADPNVHPSLPFHSADLLSPFDLMITYAK